MSDGITPEQLEPLLEALRRHAQSEHPDDAPIFSPEESAALLAAYEQEKAARDTAQASEARLRELIADVADRLRHAESVDPNELTGALASTPDPEARCPGCGEKRERGFTCPRDDFHRPAPSPPDETRCPTCAGSRDEPGFPYRKRPALACADPFHDPTPSPDREPGQTA